MITKEIQSTNYQTQNQTTNHELETTNSFMQNKPNFSNNLMNINPPMKNCYEQKPPLRPLAKQTQSNPISKITKYPQSSHTLHLKPVKRQLYFYFSICSRYISSKPSDHYDSKEHRRNNCCNPAKTDIFQLFPGQYKHQKIQAHIRQNGKIVFAAITVHVRKQQK
ncbi:MAG: hypothetical protein ACYS9Y_03430 [Planctomycetota bacterium]